MIFATSIYHESEKSQKVLKVKGEGHVVFSLRVISL